jgi:two-component system phosphate regulon response regulator PhoB
LHTILIVEDEPAIRDMLMLVLEKAGYLCREAGDIRSAYSSIVDDPPSLVLLDWMLPGGSGIELLRRLKREDLTREIPVIMLTAKTTEDNVVQGLDVGADDYVTKPFAPRELLARVNALVRRTVSVNIEGKLTAEDLLLDETSHRVMISDSPVEIGPTEFKLLRFFMSHQERAYTRGQLLDQVWGANVYVEERTVDVHIRRLRKALDDTREGYGSMVETVRGTGYRFSPRGLL